MVCAEFFKSGTVLSGTVVAEIAEHGDGDFISGWTYRVAVDRVFRGPQVRTIELFTENDTGRLRLKPGSQYLLFAERREGKWTIGGCGNSRPLKDAQGLIHQIERVGKGSNGDIYGRIFSGPSGSGASGMEVVARGSMKKYRAVSGSDGSFHMTVRPGRYKVVVQSGRASPYDLSYDDPSDFEVPKGGCAQVQFIASGG